MTSNDKLTEEDHAYIDRVAFHVLPALVRQNYTYAEVVAVQQEKAGKIDDEDAVNSCRVDYGDCAGWKEVAEEAYFIGWAMWYARHEVLAEKKNPLVSVAGSVDG